MLTASVLLYTGLAEATAHQQQEIVCNGDAEDIVITSCPDCVVDLEIKRLLRFRKLVDEWRHERGAMSSITETVMLRPYQSIIGMGVDAIPLILAELKSEGDDPDQWFWALISISEANGLNPPQIREEDRGNFKKMADAWLEWGEAQDYAG